MRNVVKVTHKGDFKKTTSFLNRVQKLNFETIFDKYGKMGVDELRRATPKDTGKTAASWGYTVEVGHDSATVIWTNNNINQGENIALLIQYGHGTATGGYVRGFDYINPAMDRIYEKCLDEIWREVSK